MQVALTVIYAPGVGEDLAQDPEYLRMYEQNLERCDVVLWVVSARDRAVALDHMHLRKLSPFHQRIVLGVNQADLVEPMDWVEKYNISSAEQERNLREIEAGRSAARSGRFLGRIKRPRLCGYVRTGVPPATRPPNPRTKSPIAGARVPAEIGDDRSRFSDANGFMAAPSLVPPARPDPSRTAASRTTGSPPSTTAGCSPPRPPRLSLQRCGAQPAAQGIHEHPHASENK
jgi:hypothetical protein